MSIIFSEYLNEFLINIILSNNEGQIVIRMAHVSTEKFSSDHLSLPKSQKSAMRRAFSCYRKVKIRLL